MKKKKRRSKRRKLRNLEYYDLMETFDGLYSAARKGAAFDDLYPLVISQQNLMLAYRSIKNHKGSKCPGVNRRTIADIKKLNMKSYVSMMRWRLTNYQPSPVKCIEIPKNHSGKRVLSIPTIEERLLMQSIQQALDPICEAHFHKHSYGFRPLRNTLFALARIEQLIRHGYIFVIELDIKKCFDYIDHDILLGQVYDLGIHDRKILSLIQKSLLPKKTCMQKGVPRCGVGQGSPLSPILANIALNKFDWWIDREYPLNKGKMKKVRSVRYADDITLLCDSFETALTVHGDVRRWLDENLGLNLKPAEDVPVKYALQKEVSVLGFSIKAKRRNDEIYVQSRIADTTKEKIIKTVLKKITSPLFAYAESAVSGVAAMLVGLHRYYCDLTNSKQDFKEILDTVTLQAYETTNKNNFWDSLGRFFLLHRKDPPRSIACRLFPQYQCIYSKSGRHKIFRRASVNPLILKKLADNPEWDKTVEYNDNRLALYVGQAGKCAISGETLSFDDMVIHLIKRKSDAYRNMVYVTKRMKFFIVSTPGQMKAANVWPYELKKKGYRKLNYYRTKAGKEELSYEFVMNERKTNMESDLNIMKRDVVDIVAERIIDLNRTGELNIPHNYSVANAIKAAWLILQDIRNKSGKPVYECCPKNNIANALLSMVIQGLDPNKNQCYFIIYGDKLLLQRSYFGSMALAMRVDSTIKAILPEVIYKDDVFEYEKSKGRTVIKAHQQSLSNIDKKKIVGAYCTVIYKDGTEDNEIMSFDEIKQSWTMSKNNVIDEKGGLVAGDHHEKFTAEACKKTVVNRICKRIINSSDDRMYFSKFLENDAYIQEHAGASRILPESNDGIDWGKLDAVSNEAPFLVNEDGVVLEDGMESEDNE